MAAATDISHTGEIVAIDPDFITVKIVSESACSQCHAAAFCGTADAAEKLISVPFSLGDWSVGQQVNVMLRRSMGFKAVWLAYAIPLLVLLAVLLGLLAAGLGELTSALIAIGAVALYYLGLLSQRDRLRNEYSFYITRI